MQHDAGQPHTTAAGAADDLEEINEDPTAAVRATMKKAGLEALEKACPQCWDAQRRMVSPNRSRADAYGRCTGMICWWLPGSHIVLVYGCTERTPLPASSAAVATLARAKGIQ